jgi:hypothetical protein
MSDEARPRPWDRVGALWRRRAVRAGVAVAVVAAFVAVTAVAIGGPTPSVPTTTVHLGGRPVALVVDGETLWVTGPSGRVWKVAQSSGRATQHRSAGKIRPSAIAVGAGGVWVVGPGAPWVWRFDPAPFAAAERIRVDGPPFDVAVGAGAVWVTIPDEHELVRIDPQSKHVVAKIRLRGIVPRSVVVAGDAVWVADPGVGAARVDAKTRKKKGALEVIPLKAGTGPAGPAGGGAAPLSCAAASGSGAIWVANPGGTVSRIDPSKGRLVATIEVGGRPVGLAVRDGSVWVTDAAAGSISRIDPETGAVTSRALVGAGAACVGVTDEAAWVAVPDDGGLTRLGPAPGPQPGRPQT